MIHHLIFTLNINIWSMETPSANGHLSLVWYTWCFCWEPAPIPWHSSGLCLTSFTSWPRATPHSAPSTQQAAIWGRIPLTCFEPSYFKVMTACPRRPRFSKPANCWKDRLISQLNCLLWQHTQVLAFKIYWAGGRCQSFCSSMVLVSMGMAYSFSSVIGLLRNCRIVITVPFFQDVGTRFESECCLRWKSG